jgi:hypothetical protein
VLDLLSEEFKGIFREFETFLDESSKLANTATFFTEYFLGVGCTNDDLKKKCRCCLEDEININQGGFKIPQYERGLHGHRNQSNPPQRVRG